MLSVAILTPAGRGAVATVGVRGPGAIDRVQPHFAAATRRLLSQAPAGRILFGRFHSTLAADEEIVAVVIGAGEVELHCHGGPAAAGAIVHAIVAAGAQQLPWQQWIANEDDENAVECRVALAAATTERTCGILLDQYRGALAAELAHVDALLAGSDAQRREAGRRLARLVQLADSVGRHLTTPCRIVIAGEPNVGKSSLINALVGYQRSIVFDQPGTTRDALSALTALDGWPIELVDTAGLRTAGDSLEAAGIKRTHQELAAADRIVLVTDAAASDPIVVPPILSGAILIGNKGDLLDEPTRQLWQQQHPRGLLTSALTGEGITPLCRAIAGSLAPVAPVPGEAVPFTERQRRLVQSRLAAAGDWSSGSP